MGLFKTTLMGTGAALVSVAAAQAADLPVRKAAPVEYVRVCDAYGAGFFFIPGTNTCLRISGRVRADYAIVGTGDIYSALGTQNVQNSVTRQSVGANGLVVEDANTVFLTNGGGAPTQIFNSATGALVGLSGGTALGVGTVVNTGTTVFVRNPGRAGNGDPVVAIPGDSENLTGWEARGRMGFDARTATTWGTVQAVAQLRMARQTGILQVTGVGEAGSTAAGVTLEAAYVRFAGFTFGAARDNFANMPSVMYMAAGHWASFANGAKQLAYTHTFGGGFSATLAIQDYLDTAAGARAVGAENSVYIGGANCLGAECYGNILPGNLFASTFDRTIRYRYDTAQLNGRVDWQQGWGALGLAAAVANPSFNNVSDTYDERKTVWAVGGTLTFNLPMLASGSRIDLTAAYADGMTEYTTNWNSFKSSDSARNVNGFVLLPTSVVLGPDGPETVKSWSVGALFQHFWTPEWRMALAASYGQVEGTRSSKACLWNGGSCFGDATVSYVAGQLAWLPTRDFEIGVELAYARVSQDVRGYTGNFGVGTANISPVYATNSVVRASDDNWTGRLRVERNF